MLTCLDDVVRNHAILQLRQHFSQCTGSAAPAVKSLSKALLGRSFCWLIWAQERKAKGGKGHDDLRYDGGDTPQDDQDAQDAQQRHNSETREEGKEKERCDLEETISASHNDLKDDATDTPQDAQPQHTHKDKFLDNLKKLSS
eukprot:12393100-Ditylum_brightwellii.AAC.1